jgi:beta-glucosidase
LAGNGVSRPLLQLKGFEKVLIGKGESVEVMFTLEPNDLAFYKLDNTFGPEAGMFEIYIGSSSDNLPLKSKFELTD